MNWKNIQRNWKTNLVSIAAFIYTVPAVVECVQSWANHQPCNWRGAVLGLFIAIGAAVAKDSSNVPTHDEVQAETQKENIKQQVEALKNKPLTIQSQQPQQTWKPKGAK